MSQLILGLLPHSALFILRSLISVGKLPHSSLSQIHIYVYLNQTYLLVSNVKYFFFRGDICLDSYTQAPILRPRQVLCP